MKKYIITLMAAIIILLPNIIEAAEKAPATIVRVADMGVTELQNSIQASAFSKAVQKNLPLKFSPVWRLEKLDIKNRNLQGYMTSYGLKEAEKPAGSIIYYVDSTGYVSEMRLSLYKDVADAEKITGAVAAIIMNSLGLSYEESTTMFKSKAKIKNVWSYNKNRRFLFFEKDSMIWIAASDARN